MEPELFVFAAVFVLMALYAASQALTWHRGGGLARLLAYLPQRRSAPHTTPQPAPRIVRRQPPARRVIRSREELADEKLLIRLGLSGGMKPERIARLLRGSQRYNQRRVRELAARPAAVPQRRAEAAA